MTAYPVILDVYKRQSYNSHGTHVAGIISKATAGLDNIKLLPLKVLDSRGKGTVSALVESVKYAKEAEVDIINLSLGLYPYYHSKALEMAILEAITSGITVVIASGNDNIDTMNSCPSHLELSLIHILWKDSAKALGLIILALLFLKKRDNPFQKLIFSICNRLT